MTIEKKIKAAREQGIRWAAGVAAAYDNLSSHDHLVSECILAKLNLLKRKPRRNRAARKNS